MTDGTPAARRAVLLGAMDVAARRGIGCGTCVGTCCTFVANSMQITREEAKDLVDFLRDTGEATGDLITRLEDNVARFGLDRPMPGTGARVLMRRRYTCPFYDGGRLGCRIAPTHKPMGCLAFNPRRPGVADGEDCGSTDDLLERQRNAAPPGPAAPPRDWDKLPIPMAVLAVLAEAP